MLKCVTNHYHLFCCWGLEPHDLGIRSMKVGVRLQITKPP